MVTILDTIFVAIMYRIKTAMNDWAKLVNKIYKEKSSTNKNYKLMHAMKDAKKVYKKNKTMKAGRAGKSRKNRAAK